MVEQKASQGVFSWLQSHLFHFGFEFRERGDQGWISQKEEYKNNWKNKFARQLNILHLAMNFLLSLIKREKKFQRI